jgi:hypothetical protein
MSGSNFVHLSFGKWSFIGAVSFMKQTIAQNNLSHKQMGNFVGGILPDNVGTSSEMQSRF